MGRPPRPCTELARLEKLPLPVGTLERSCEIRERPDGIRILVGPYSIRKPDGTRVATGQFVEGKPFGRWQLFDDQGKPSTTFDFPDSR